MSFVDIIIVSAVLSSAVNAQWTEMCNCTCSWDDDWTSLLVDCDGSPDIDADQLTEQLDSLLSSNLTYGRLTSLSIVNSPLTHVPRSVCRLTTLTYLHLDNNRLTRLPDNCLTNLTALTQLSASANNISQLQDGLFDQLQQLAYISLSKNAISSIGLRVFNSSAMLTSLNRVDLADNRIQVLEPWVYFVGINGRLGQHAIVNLDTNYISAFSNKMGLTVTNGTKVMYLKLILNGNRIEHISDMLHAWGISLAALFRLSPIVDGSPTSSISLAYNYLICDCKDYAIYKLARASHIDSVLEGTFCRDMIRQRPYTIPLELLVCQIPKRCPPGCRCVHRPWNATLHVYCSNTNLTAVPAEQPKLPKSYTKYSLDFSHNPLLRRLEHQYYFANTTILDASNCAVEVVTNWERIAKIPEINLFGNRFASFPQSYSSVGVFSEKINLANNPWDCSCGNKWMASWLRSIAPRLTQIVVCQTPGRLRGRNIIEIPDEELCVDPAVRAVAITLSSVAGAVVVLLSVVVVVYRLRVRLYTRWKFHPFDRDECLGEDMDYDAFLACSSEDHDVMAQRILETVEAGGYRVCYHYRDFSPGLITDNILESVTRSKRTVCVLTENFLRSAFCIYEFEAALHHWISNKRTKRLIVLMALNNPNDLYANDASDTAMLRQYVRQYTYIDYAAGDWLDKLLYALPLRGMNQQQSENADEPFVKM